jgi:hypothetical protein
MNDSGAHNQVAFILSQNITCDSTSPIRVQHAVALTRGLAVMGIARTRMRRLNRIQRVHLSFELIHILLFIRNLPNHCCKCLCFLQFACFFSRTTNALVCLFCVRPGMLLQF